MITKCSEKPSHLRRRSHHCRYRCSVVVPSATAACTHPPTRPPVRSVRLTVDYRSSIRGALNITERDSWLRNRRRLADEVKQTKVAEQERHLSPSLVHGASSTYTSSSRLYHSTEILTTNKQTHTHTYTHTVTECLHVPRQEQ